MGERKVKHTEMNSSKRFPISTCSELFLISNSGLLLPLLHISTLVMFRQIYRQPYVKTVVHILSKLWTRFNINITLIICGEGYKPWKYSLCNFLRSPVSPTLLGPNVFLSSLYVCSMNYLHCYSHFMRSNKFPIHKRIY